MLSSLILKNQGEQRNSLLTLLKKGNPHLNPPPLRRGGYSFQILLSSSLRGRIFLPKSSPSLWEGED